MRKHPKRVMIIGSAGSGKSTLARLFADRLGLPVYHMDREVFWLPGWVERNQEDQVYQIKRISALEEWVFEGNKSSTFHIREARADMADGCPERIAMLLGFWWFILKTSTASRRKQAAFFEKTALPKHRLETLRDVETFLGKYSA